MKKYEMLVLIGALLFSATDASAGTVIDSSEPAPGSRSLAEADIMLERSDRLKELESFARQKWSNPAVRITTLTCDGTGWFAEADGYNDGSKANGAVCGASSKDEAASEALRLCRQRASSGVSCSLSYVKYDDESQSFLNEYTLSSYGPQYGTI